MVWYQKLPFNNSWQLLPIAFAAVPKVLFEIYILLCVPKHNKFIWFAVFNILLICILHVEVAGNDAIFGKVIFIAVLVQLQNIISGNGNVNVMDADIVIAVPILYKLFTVI